MTQICFLESSWLIIRAHRDSDVAHQDLDLAHWGSIVLSGPSDLATGLIWTYRGSLKDSDLADQGSS